MIKLPKDPKKLFFTADPHFSHAKILEYCNRPFKNVSDMDHALVRNWNATVKHKDDVTVIVGDLCMGKLAKLPHFISNLKGHKILVLGNHDDYKVNAYLKMGFDSVHTSIVFNYDVDTYVAHDPAEYTMLSDRDFMICGHVHKLFTQMHGCVNCGVDVHNYRPVSYGRLYQMYLKEVWGATEKEVEVLDA